MSVIRVMRTCPGRILMVNHVSVRPLGAGARGRPDPHRPRAEAQQWIAVRTRPAPARARRTVACRRRTLGQTLRKSPSSHSGSVTDRSEAVSCKRVRKALAHEPGFKRDAEAGAEEAPTPASRGSGAPEATLGTQALRAWVPSALLGPPSPRSSDRLCRKRTRNGCDQGAVRRSRSRQPRRDPAGVGRWGRSERLGACPGC